MKMLIFKIRHNNDLFDTGTTCIKGKEDLFYIFMNMSEANQGNNPDASAIVPVKRKRGRPRKYPKSGLDPARDSHAPRGHNPNHGERYRVPPESVGVHGNQPRQVDPVNNPTDLMVGQTVHGIIEAAFDAGYLLTVRVSNSETTLRGVVFKAGHYVPVSADNDVAPGVQMIRRNEMPLPRENYAQVHSHNSRSRERNGNVHAARVANPVVSKGKQVSSVATETPSGVSGGNLVPAVLQPINSSNGPAGEPSSIAAQPDHAMASKGKQVLVDAHPSNGSTPTEQVQAVQTHLQFQFQNNRQVTPSGIQQEAGLPKLLQEAEAKSMELPAMPFERLLTEVIKRNQVPTQSTETDTSSAGKLSTKDSSIATEDDVNDSDQALSVEPLQAVQPDLHNHPTVVLTPLENYRTGKMTELLQERMTENKTTHAQDLTADHKPKLDEWRSQEPEDGDEGSGHSKNRSRSSSV
ncbi:uncharacterized protein LOC8282897 isoform X3 [Ricinus communis]|uniref:uncharacterized protein LOC8282897 isoform X3 n=1 Tax=Ricinus communis TaxID=3988 RepID=UPI00201ACCDD|nr:uncharacterized protein LOC8282897 isoform X3 [Ricinus communis]